MTWAAIALAGAMLSAFINIIDKAIIHSYARTPQTQPLAIGLTMPLVGASLLLFAPIPTSAPPNAIASALVSGTLYGLGAQILLRILYAQEASRAVPIYQTYPIFTALIAFLLLGETLDPLAWIAILAIVAGAALLTARIGSPRARPMPNAALLILILGSAIEGASHVLGKAAVDHLPVLTTHALRMLALSAVLLSLNLRPRPLADLKLLVRRRSPALPLIALNQFVVANLGLLMIIWALSLGPAAPVAALTSLRTFFLVAFTIAISLIWRGSLGERTTPRDIALKLSAAALIVAGAAAIAARAP